MIHNFFIEFDFTKVGDGSRVDVEEVDGEQIRFFTCRQLLISVFSFLQTSVSEWRNGNKNELVRTISSRC